MDEWNPISHEQISHNKTNFASLLMGQALYWKSRPFVFISNCWHHLIYSVQIFKMAATVAIFNPRLAPLLFRSNWTLEIILWKPHIDMTLHSRGDEKRFSRWLPYWMSDWQHFHSDMTSYKVFQRKPMLILPSNSGGEATTNVSRWLQRRS